MQVISANSNNFSAAREEIAQGMDMRRDSAEWERDMVEPIRELIVDLATLSKGWARGAVELTLVSAMLVGALVCCALSPTVRPWAQEQSGNDWVGTAFSLACVFERRIHSGARIVASPPTNRPEILSSRRAREITRPPQVHFFNSF